MEGIREMLLLTWKFCRGVRRYGLTETSIVGDPMVVQPPMESIPESLFYTPMEVRPDDLGYTTGDLYECPGCTF